MSASAIDLVTDIGKIVTCDPEILGGTPVFAGTRVPVRTLVDYLTSGASIERFLDGFPTVKREQVIAFLRESMILALREAS